jgi:hypothetical protein
MPFQRRLLVIMTLALVALCAYGAASYYSPSMVAFVVEQALLQKLPDDADPGICRRRFQGLISGLPDKKAQLARLLEMSQQIEKVQKLSRLELETLLSLDSRVPGESQN